MPFFSFSQFSFLFRLLSPFPNLIFFPINLWGRKSSLPPFFFNFPQFFPFLFCLISFPLSFSLPFSAPAFPLPFHFLFFNYYYLIDFLTIRFLLLYLPFTSSYNLPATLFAFPFRFPLYPYSLFYFLPFPFSITSPFPTLFS